MPSAQVREPAGLGRRLAAMLYDGLLLLAIWIVTGLVWFPLNGAAVSGPLLTMVLALETFAFYAYCWRRHGETLGMRAWQIRLVAASGQPPSWPQIGLRLLSACVSLSCFGLGYLWLYLGKTRQTWHDLASDTYVVHIPR